MRLSRLLGAALALVASLWSPSARAEVPVEEISCVQLQAEALCRKDASFLPCSDPVLAFAAQELQFRLTVDVAAHAYVLLRLPGDAYTVVHVPLEAGTRVVPAPGSFMTELGTVESSRVIVAADADPALDALAGTPSDGVPEAFLLAAARYAQMTSRCQAVPVAEPAQMPAPKRAGRPGAVPSTGAGAGSDEKLLRMEESGSEPDPAPEEGGAFIEPNIVR